MFIASILCMGMVRCIIAILKFHSYFGHFWRDFRFSLKINILAGTHFATLFSPYLYLDYCQEWTPWAESRAASEHCCKVIQQQWRNQTLTSFVGDQVYVLDSVLIRDNVRQWDGYPVLIDYTHSIKVYIFKCSIYLAAKDIFVFINRYGHTSIHSGRCYYVWQSEYIHES